MRQDESTKSEEQYYIGVDAAGLRSYAFVCNSNGERLNACYGGVSNPARIGKETAAKNVVSVAASVANLVDRDLAPEAIGGIVVGLPDVGAETGRCKVLLDNDPLLFGVPLYVTSDKEIAIFGVAPDRSGILQVSDISATTFARAGSGGTCRLGSYALGGNPGSSVSIATNSIRLASRGSAETELTDRLVAHFMLNNLADFSISLDYLSRDFKKFQETVNEVVKVTADAAYNGDALCHQLFVDAAEALSNSTIEGIERMNLNNEVFPVGLVGGTWDAGDLVMRPYLERIRNYAPHAFVQSDAKEPAHSAALMAIRKFHW